MLAIRKNRVCYSCSRKGIKTKPASESRKEKIRNALLGKPLTEERKENIRKNKVGIPLSDDHKQKLRLSWVKGRKPYSEDFGKQVSKRQKGKTFSDERKKNIRLGVINAVIRKNGGISTRYNIKACKYFDKLNEEMGWNLQHALNSKDKKEYYVKGLGYFLDAYDEKRNIVVEYDEPRHNQPWKKKNDMKRQSEIADYLHCDFYRYKEKEGKLYRFTNNILEPVCSTPQVTIVQ